MSGISLTPALRAEYERLFETCVIRPERAAVVERLAGQLAATKTRYENVGRPLGIPWPFIAVTHSMESSQRFDRHLHNGDPLTARTRQVPAGRPRTGNPPFTWEESAKDALTMKGLGTGTDWSLAGMLYQLERYNGWGYRRYHPHVLSPYLWSFSTHYRSGKYVADGRWSETAVSQQCGAAVLLRRMIERGLFGFSDQRLPSSETPKPLIIGYRATKFADSEKERQALALQTWLNTHPGIFVKLDGIPGQRTSDAYRSVTGHYLPGDPRG